MMVKVIPILALVAAVAVVPARADPAVAPVMANFHVNGDGTWQVSWHAPPTLASAPQVQGYVVQRIVNGVPDPAIAVAAGTLSFTDAPRANAIVEYTVQWTSVQGGPPSLPSNPVGNWPPCDWGGIDPYTVPPGFFLNPDCLLVPP
ncbi:MAG: hypothetical protein ACYDBQ_02585 [Thermoplasmatota archaeon]